MRDDSYPYDEDPYDDDTPHEYIPVTYDFDDEVCGICNGREFNDRHLCYNCKKRMGYNCAKVRCS
jgi:hypothetical protein